MPTSKKRINITLLNEEDKALSRLAERDNVPQATKASELLRLALEIDEDQIWDSIAKKRDTAKAKFATHKKAWL